MKLIVTYLYYASSDLRRLLVILVVGGWLLSSAVVLICINLVPDSPYPITLCISVRSYAQILVTVTGILRSVCYL